MKKKTNLIVVMAAITILSPISGKYYYKHPEQIIPESMSEQKSRQRYIELKEKLKDTQAQQDGTPKWDIIKRWNNARKIKMLKGEKKRIEKRYPIKHKKWGRK